MAVSEIWVIAELKEGKFGKITFEMLSQGKKLAEQTGKTLCAVVLGESTTSNLAEALGEYGAQKVYAAEDANLKDYTTDAYAAVVCDLIKEKHPQVVLFGHTAVGKDLAPHVAERLKTGLASDVTEINVTGNGLEFVRPIYAGKAFATVTVESNPIMASIRPNVFAVEAAGGVAEIEKVNAVINPGSLRTIIKEIIQSAGNRVQLTEAEVIVSGGRGLKDSENFKLLEDLADQLGAAVGASRGAVDAGWISPDFQVGQTGKTVASTIYIACGISGAIQHLAGMSSSKFIIAINKDPEANIFNIADLGLVGDLFEILPILVEELKSLKKQMVS